MIILLHGAVRNGFELPFNGCFLEWTDSRAAGTLGRLGAKFQLIVIAKEEIDIDDIFAENTLPENVYLTLEETHGTEEGQVKKEKEREREARNETAVRLWREEESRRLDDEKRLFKVTTREKADKRLKSNLFLSFFDRATLDPRLCKLTSQSCGS